MIASGLGDPSAVKFGCGPGWPSDHLYVVGFEGNVYDLSPPPRGAGAAGHLRRNRALDCPMSYRRFRGVITPRGVTLDVIEGEVHVLVGENGVGKSTLMTVVADSIIPR